MDGFDDSERRERLRERQQRLHQRMTEVLGRALDDPAFRQELMDNPQSIFERAAGENAPPEFPPRVRELRRDFLQEVFELAGTDSDFRRQLGENPREAFAHAGFGPQLERIRAEMPQEEVRGFGWTWNSTLWGWIPAYLATGTPGGA